jgi:3-oxoacyl-[acyl-carrier-protein] synthase-3
MRNAGAVICGLGGAQPDHLVPNEVICEQLDVSPEWIATRTGITHRARADQHVSTADLAVRAGIRAIASCGHAPVHTLIVATISPDQRCPATAPQVAARLGLAGIPAFDVAAACSGLLYALQIAAGLLACGTAERVLVIAADRISRLTDPTDPVTAPLFGDGAGALVVRAGSSAEPGAVGPILLGADGTNADAIVVPHGGFMAMQGKTTFQQAVERMADVAQHAARAAGWELRDIDWLVPHQANARITAAVARRLGIDETRVLQHIERVGNTSAASIPLALTQAVLDDRLGAGHRVLLAAFGAGLTWGATTAVWPDLPVTPVSASGKDLWS